MNEISKKRKVTGTSKERRSLIDMAKALARIQKASPGTYDVTFRLVTGGRVEQLFMVRVADVESENEPEHDVVRVTRTGTRAEGVSGG